MTYRNIYDFFKDDNELLNYFDPFSKANNNEEAAMEIYHKLIDHTKERECKFERSDIGYVFHSDGLLISFCVKPEYRTKDNLIKFGEFIKKIVGEHFQCYLFNKNSRAINFLKKIGMKKEVSNGLITLLTI